MAEKVNTVQKIMDAALDLFSVQGYEATSISQIAEAVGIRKASLYSHFASKQELLDALMQNFLKQYEEHSIFTRAENNALSEKGNEDITPENVVRTILWQIGYIVHDPKIGRARKMLTIEQFRNKQMADLLTKQNYTDVLRYFTGVIEYCIGQGKLIDRGAEIMAAQLCLPISVWINLCDREPQRENEIFGLIEKHVSLFFETYKA